MNDAKEVFTDDDEQAKADIGKLLALAREAFAKDDFEQFVVATRNKEGDTMVYIGAATDGAAHMIASVLQRINSASPSFQFRLMAWQMELAQQARPRQAPPPPDTPTDKTKLN